jgi:hypothetical protein
VADDFIVDVYHNSVKVPVSRRELLEERFGRPSNRSTSRSIKEIGSSSTLSTTASVGSASYFGAASCFGKDEFGFVSGIECSCWSECDVPRDVQKFIARKNFLSDQPASLQTRGEMAPSHAALNGSAWRGQPIWDQTPSPWLNVIAE